MGDPTGYVRFIELVNCYLAECRSGVLPSRACPTISTRKGRFAPVLVASHPDFQDKVDYMFHSMDWEFLLADEIGRLLGCIESGEIPDATELNTAIRAKLLPIAGRRNHDGLLFDLLYGALQLLAANRKTSSEQRYTELFKLTTGFAFAYAGLSRSHSKDLFAHVEHFLVHAAVFLSASSTDNQWADIMESANQLLEEWGEEPAGESVLIHAAHNLEIHCQGVPSDDFEYALIKRLRKRYKDKQVTLQEVVDILSLTLEWRHSYPLLRILWPQILEGYIAHEAHLLQECELREGANAAQALARKRGYLSPSGIPYLKKGFPLTKSREFVLSFPGGWSIGKTSLLCKVSTKRLLFDFGAENSGRTPRIQPDLLLLDGVFITHGHQDHIGGLLDLYNREIYEGPWFGLNEGRELFQLALEDKVKLQEVRHSSETYYPEDLVTRVMAQFVGLSPGAEFEIAKGVNIKAFRAGHVPGACQYLVSHEGVNIMISGDFNTRESLSVPVIEYPSAEEIEKTIGVVVEGTYFSSDEVLLDAISAQKALLEEISRATQFPVLLPVLSLGRAQEVIMAFEGTNYRVGVFGLAAKMTQSSGILLPSNVKLDFRMADRVSPDEYDVIVASSGCLQGGPSASFWKREDLQPLHIVLTGYLFPGTPAKSLADKIPRIRFSAHAPRSDWDQYVAKFAKAKYKFLFHVPSWPTGSLPSGVVIPRTHKEYSVLPDN